MKYVACASHDINPGLAYVISYLKSQGHEVMLIFDPCTFNRGGKRNGILAKIFSIEKYNIRKIKKFNPDAALFSAVTATYIWALSFAEKVKKEVGCKILFGGVHPTLVPEEVRKHDFIDEVIVGDGVEYFGGKFDPDHLFWDREIFLKELPPAHRKTQIFMTSFGCPFNCSFCGNEQLRKVKKFKYLRRKVGSCIKELKEMKENGCKRVLFVDDIFTCDKQFVTSFLDIYKRDIGLPFTCFGHANFLDKPVIDKLKQAGCEMVWIGIQCGDQGIRQQILARPETNKQIIDCCKLIKESGMKLMIDHIFGIPFEANMSQDISIALYREIKADVVNCYELLYFPKAKIIDHALKCGYLSPADVDKINRGEGIVYQVGNKGQYFYDTFAPAMISIPLGSILWEFLPMPLVKLIIHARAGRLWMAFVIIQNEIYFTVNAILKKLKLK